MLTIEYLGLQRRKYSYAEIGSIIAEKLTEAAYDAICAECEWKKKRVCTYADVMHPDSSLTKETSCKGFPVYLSLNNAEK